MKEYKKEIFGDLYFETVISMFKTVKKANKKLEKHYLSKKKEKDLRVIQTGEIYKRKD